MWMDYLSKETEKLSQKNSTPLKKICRLLIGLSILLHSTSSRLLNLKHNLIFVNGWESYIWSFTGEHILHKLKYVYII